MDPRPDIAEKAALTYLLFGHLLPDDGELMVRLMEEHSPCQDDTSQSRSRAPSR